MHRSQRLPSLCLALTILLLAAPVLAERLEETFEETLDFASGDTLQVDNTNGNIKIESWDRDEVFVEARKKARAHSEEAARQVLEHIEIDISQSAGSTIIETRLPRKREGVLDWLSGRDASASVSYLIRVPRSANLDLKTVNGHLEITEIFGELDLGTTNGGIKVHDSGGSVTGKTTNGGIEVELNEVDPNEDMRLRTTNGSIRLRLPSDLGVDLKARTTNGSIHTDLPVQVRGSMSRRSIEGEINGGGSLLDLRTTNGSIKIEEM